MGRSEITGDDGRGAVALNDAARSARVFNPMSETEALKSGVSPEHRRFYFREDNGKASMAPPTGAKWRRFISQSLYNGSEDLADDEVGVVTVWQWIDADLVIDDDQQTEILDILASGEYGPQSNGKNWAGVVMGDVLDLDMKNAHVKRLVANKLSEWEAEKITKRLLVQKRGKAKGEMKPLVKPFDWKAPPPTTGA